MAQFGPAFLHKPLPDLDAAFLQRAYEWWLEGLAIAAPQWLKHTGWRPVYQIVLRNGSNEARFACVERSALGLMRISPKESAALSAPLALEIPNDDIFETRADVPIEARHSLREAIGHRLASLSPLASSDVDFAIGDAAPTAAGRLGVDVAIVRKSSIESALRDSVDRPVRLVGAKADERGEFKFVFFERSQNALTRKNLLAALSLIAAAAILAAGADHYFERRIAAASAIEAYLIETLRREKDATRFLDSLPEDFSAGETINASERLRLLATVLPEGVWLEEISLTGGETLVRGYAPQSAIWPKEAKPILNPSDRPGIARFELILTTQAP